MKKILLISVSDVKENTLITSNVEEKVIINSILETQDLELLPILGKLTYKRLLSEVEQSITVANYVLSVPDKALLDEYIKPVMIYGTLVNSFIPIHYKLSNKGAQSKTDTNSKTADKSELELLRGHYVGKFENYKRRLIDYLTEDDDKTTNPEQGLDTTYQSTGWLLPDDDGSSDLEQYLSRAYKTGYYRRY
jgi:hypothetical protein